MFDLFANLGATGTEIEISDNYIYAWWFCNVNSIIWNFIIILFVWIEEQLDFPVLYASAKEGWASTTFTKDPPADARNMSQLLDAVVRHVPPPNASIDAPFQMLVGI